MMRIRLVALITMGVFLFPHGGHATDAPPAAGTKSADSGQPMTEGLVKKVDRDLGKVTIRHGPIDNLGMPKMTMVFRVKDPSMLDQLKEGDQIRFVADKVNGVFPAMLFEPEK